MVAQPVMIPSAVIGKQLMIDNEHLWEKCNRELNKKLVATINPVNDGEVNGGSVTAIKADLLGSDCEG